MKRLKISPSLIWFSVVIFLFWASLYVYVPIFPVHASSLSGATLGTAGLVISMYGLSQLILRIPFGVVSDRLNKREIFVYLGVIASGIAAVGLILTQSVQGAALFRGVSGVAAATWVIISILFASYFPQSLTVKATSLVVFIAVFAQMVATMAGGVIAGTFGNQATFYSAVIFAILALIFIPLIRRSDSPKTTVQSQEKAKFKLQWSLVAISLAAAVGQFITYATTYGYIPILAKQLGATSSELGWLTAAMQFAYMATSLAVSLLMPAKFEKVAALTGIAILGVASFLVVADTRMTTIFISRLLHGLGHGLSYPVLMGLAIKPIQNHHRATAMGIFQAIYALGMFAGPAASGWISNQAGLMAVFSSSGWIALSALPIIFIGLRLMPAAESARMVPAVEIKASKG
ncbi:MAG TPA: MFS transporter [Anaerolineaceae bacterium]|jgi:MFS family permease|nr:MFS transporter [Anaerolineaceae bacterium]HOU44845.1 MFS transporter [Anaerolineaceae bacterium]HQF46163.1 MFS transporter [Anaerolineaceae bacterium]HQH36071.1 MFS transporter [Anaerolineaceae bacterium]HQJ04234.1 MFS transporter [Anaerolineaceae bacterium]